MTEVTSLSISWGQLVGSDHRDTQLQKDAVSLESVQLRV